jgi:hypothetical protein
MDRTGARHSRCTSPLRTAVHCCSLRRERTRRIGLGRGHRAAGARRNRCRWCTAPDRRGRSKPCRPRSRSSPHIARIGRSRCRTRFARWAGRDNRGCLRRCHRRRRSRCCASSTSTREQAQASRSLSLVSSTASPSEGSGTLGAFEDRAAYHRAFHAFAVRFQSCSTAAWRR